MKKKLILFLVPLMLFCSCGSTSDTFCEDDYERFVPLEQNSRGILGGYTVVFDKFTGVMYTISSDGEFTLLVKEDGSPQIWGNCDVQLRKIYGDVENSEENYDDLTIFDVLSFKTVENPASEYDFEYYEGLNLGDFEELFYSPDSTMTFSHGHNLRGSASSGGSRVLVLKEPNSGCILIYENFDLNWVIYPDDEQIYFYDRKLKKLELVSEIFYLKYEDRESGKTWSMRCGDPRYADGSPVGIE